MHDRKLLIRRKHEKLLLQRIPQSSKWDHLSDKKATGDQTSVIDLKPHLGHHTD